jgi:polysaccharide biosynthesis/export protein
MKLSILTEIIILMLLSASCVPVEKLSYFNDFDELEEPSVNIRNQKLIMPFDKLYIEVLSIDPLTSQIFNTNSEIGRYSSNGIMGYMVDEGGNIRFPFVGNINVGSITTSQAADKIQKALGEYVSNISVTVKYIDNQVTLVGEVQRPGVFQFIQDKLTIYEALGLGGGISRYGDRKKVVLIRQEGNKIVHYRLNLTDSKISTKDFYYIIPNDVIVVEPLKSISSSYSNITYTNILSTITTLVAVLLLFNTVK